MYFYRMIAEQGILGTGRFINDLAGHFSTHQYRAFFKANRFPGEKIAAFPLEQVKMTSSK